MADGTDGTTVAPKKAMPQNIGSHTFTKMFMRPSPA